MRFNPDDWEQTQIPTNLLALDFNNPRFAFRPFPTNEAAIQYLIDKENIIDLAKKIASYGGLYKSEKLIVWRRGDNDFVVLEGNRRTLACKILLRPTAYFHDDERFNAVPEIDEETKTRISTLDSVVVGDRRIADPLIANMHVFGKKDWHFLSRMYYAYSSFNQGSSVEEICNSLNCTSKEVYYYVRCYTAISYARESVGDDYDKMDRLLGGEIDPQHFLSIVLSPLVKSHFGTPFIWDDGRPNIVGHPDLTTKIGLVASHALFADDELGYRLSRGPIEKYLKTVFKRDTRQTEMDIPDPIRYRSPSPQAKEANQPYPNPAYAPETQDLRFQVDQQAPSVRQKEPQYLSQEPWQQGMSENIEAPSVGVPSDAVHVPADAPSSPPLQGARRLSAKETFFESLKCPIQDYRLQQITKEIAALSSRQRGLLDASITASFLARALLEWSLVYKLKAMNKLSHLRSIYKKSATYEPTLSEILQYFSEHPDGVSMPKRLSEKCAFIRTHWLTDLNCNTHNDFGNHTVQRLVSIAADIRPVVLWVFGTPEPGGEE